MLLSEISLDFEKDRFLKACKNWRNYPSKPAVYILAVDQAFKYGGKITDILYIGETKHLGGIESNCRLWDYETKATSHEANIVEKIQEIEASGKPVYVYWSCKIPQLQTHKEVEKQLLQQFKKEHGQLPILIRRE
jgi:hypothetical protein